MLEHAKSFWIPESIRNLSRNLLDGDLLAILPGMMPSSAGVSASTDGAISETSVYTTWSCGDKHCSRSTSRRGAPFLRQDGRARKQGKFGYHRNLGEVELYVEVKGSGVGEATKSG